MISSDQAPVRSGDLDVDQRYGVPCGTRDHGSMLAL